MRPPSQVPQFSGNMPGISTAQPAISAAQVTAVKQQASAGMAGEIFARAAADAIANGEAPESWREMARTARAAADAYFHEGG